MVVLFYVFHLLNVLFLFFRKKSKLLTAATFAVLIYIYYNNTGNNDYLPYLAMYKHTERFSVEPGYILLMKAAQHFSLDFNSFYCIICTACLTIIMAVYRKFSDDFQLFFSVYLIYQYFEDLNVIRNFIIRALIIVAFYYLYKGKKLHFVALTAIGALFHQTAIFYLPLVIYGNKKKFSIRAIKVMAAVVFLLCIVIFITGNNFSWLYNTLSSRLMGNDSKLDYYFTTSTRFGFILYFFLHLGNIYIMRSSLSIMNLENEKERSLYELAEFVNLYVISSFPLIMMNINFYRLYNNIFVLNYIVYAILLKNCKKDAYYFTLLKILGLNMLYALPIVHGSNQKQLVLDSIKNKGY